MTSAKEIVQASGIGSSEISAILGISPFQDAWDVYARKHNLVMPAAETEPMFWGTKLQPLIAEVFAERMELPVEWYDKPVYHPKRVWQRASPDAFILTEPRMILEVKTVTPKYVRDWGPDGSDDLSVPHYYVAQVQWQLSTLGLTSAYVAALICGHNLRIYKIAHNPKLEKILLDAGERFWQRHIVNNVAPPVGGSKAAHDYLKQRYPQQSQPLREAEGAEITWLDQYRQVYGQTKLFKERKGRLESRLKEAIGDAEGLTWSGGKLTWRKTRDGTEVNWENLAERQLVGYSEEERDAIIQEFTEPVSGHRRLLLGRKETA